MADQLVTDMAYCQISTVRAHIGRSSGRSTPSPVEVSSGQEWQYEISTVRAHIGRSSGRSTLPQDRVMNLVAQEWQYEISTVRAHIGRSTGRYISPFILLKLIVADQVADLPSPH